MKTRIRAALLTTLSLSLAAACGPNLPVAPLWNDADVDAINGAIDRSGKLKPLAEDRDDVTTETSYAGNYKYIAEKHDAVDNIDSVVHLGLNDDVIWPGSLVKGARAHDFIYDPILLPRAPMTLSLSLEGSTTGAALSKVVIDPKLSTVRQGIADLLKTAIVDDTRVPAKVDFKISQVHSESQMSLFVGANVSYGAGSLESKFNWDSTNRKNKIMARYTQVYYSVDMDTPASAAALFAPPSTVGEIERVLSPGTMPMYVASVSYGMQALMFIESDYSEQEMRAALDVAYRGSADVDLNIAAQAKQVLESSSVQVVVYGGSTAGLGSLETGYEGFKRVIDASKSFSKESPGVPLAYKFRHATDNTLALITLTSQYTIVRPVKVRQPVRLTVKRFLATAVDDEGPDNRVEMDRFYAWFTASNRHGDASSLLSTVDQQLYGWEDSGWVTMNAGDTHEVNKSVVITFDTEHFDFSQASFVIKAWGRDWDDNVNGPENAWGNLTIMGSDFLRDGGNHVLWLQCGDFTFRTEISIELVE